MTTTKLIEITDLAAKKLEETLREHEEAEQDVYLRVIVMSDDGGSPKYMLGAEKEVKDDDVVIDAGNIQVLIDSESAPLVEGAEIDYVDGLMRSGFGISNPNFQNQGCGGGGGGCGGGGGGCGCGGGGGGGCGGH